MAPDVEDVRTRRLAPGELVKVYGAAGYTVMCCAGTVWITQQNDARDVFLSPGERFTFDRDGVALIGAVEGMRDEWLQDTGIALISLPSKLLR